MSTPTPVPAPSTVTNTVVERMARGLAAYAENRTRPEGDKVKPEDMRDDVVAIWTPFARAAWEEMQKYGEEVTKELFAEVSRLMSEQRLQFIEPAGKA